MAHTHHKGGSTLELLVAFAILVTALSATVLVAFSNQSVTVDLQTNTEAIYKAQALLEEARAAVRQDFGLLNPKTMTDPSGPLTYTQKLEVKII
jgi:type II secretory pathway pseudopilin PulG